MKAVDRSIKNLIFLINKILIKHLDKKFTWRAGVTNFSNFGVQLENIEEQVSDLSEKISGVATEKFNYQQHLIIIDDNVDAIKKKIILLYEEEDEEEDNINEQKNMINETNNSIKNHLNFILSTIEDIKTMRLEQMAFKKKFTRRYRTSSRSRSLGGRKKTKKSKRRIN